ncbi:hypothetical protein CORC01_14126 [Colletotrichum orchidophilum]|uniref:NmrA-like domain-containing protein n=1 Tax=Colletotrichum orchidophilum TaxID=1209926 RepID=A0A1G4AN24_9PEZI|nr:uncharacterized protein CORC01_14126 [Colletotrichum orchidophilum]OHE90579.1 hypothetical protein CORC01_14126 [Colletotrichum orchidophilum]
MRVVVFGATGGQGIAQISALKEANHHPIAVSRRPRAASSPPIETRIAELTDRAAVRAALSGAEAVFLNLPSFQPADFLYAAAKAIGAEAAAQSSTLKIIVFNTSFPVPEKDVGIEAQEHRRETRRLLREAVKGSGVALVSIQPVVFLDNLLEGWALPRLRDEGRIVYCHKPDLEVSWISLDNLALLMVAVLTRDPAEFDGRDIAVGGPETVRLSQLAEKLGHAWGREVGYENQTVDQFSQEMAAALKSQMQSGKELEVVVDETRRAYTWYNDAEENPFKVDMAPVLKELQVTLKGIEDWGRLKGCPIQTK